MSKEDVQDVQKEWKAYGWPGALRLICRIQCTKEHTVIARTVEILEKCGYTTEDITVLKGGKTILYTMSCMCTVQYIYTVHVYYIGMYVFTV